MNYRIIAYLIGWALKIEALAMLIPGVIAAFSGEDTFLWFFVVGSAAFLLGTFLSGKRFRKGNLYSREGYVSTAVVWILISLVGALPFFLSGRMPNYLDAVFEVVSGFTTTGASVLSDVETLGYGLLFWRSLTHWLGGMGVIVLLLAVLPFTGSGSHMQLMKAESPGPKVSKLVPKVRETALVLYAIYTGMTLLMIFSYLLSGMPVFDAFCIGFGTAGTGGFAVRNSGMGEYGLASQILITIWMLLFGVNFGIYYLVINKRLKDALKSEELRWYLLIILSAVVLMTLITYFSGRFTVDGNEVMNEELFGSNFYYCFHHSAFTVSSIITTTGFSTVDFGIWPTAARVIILMLMVVGASGGSTGGGIKVSRIVLFFKQAAKELHMLIHPNATKLVLFEGKPVEHSVIRSVNNFLFLYLLIAGASILLVSFDTHNFETAFSAVLATLNNIGPGLSAVGPMNNYAGFNPFSKIVLIFDMLLGRLEILPILLAINLKTYTRKY